MAKMSAFWVCCGVQSELPVLGTERGYKDLRFSSRKRFSQCPVMNRIADICEIGLPSGDEIQDHNPKRRSVDLVARQIFGLTLVDEIIVISAATIFSDSSPFSLVWYGVPVTSTMFLALVALMHSAAHFA